MAVFRVNKNKNYTVMCNYHFKDKSLSLKAKGLLSQMLSLPDDWDYTIAGLCAINKEKESSIKSAISELKERGYLKVTKLMPNQTNSGRIEYIYDIFEYPMQHILNQDEEKQGIENQHVENPGQLNTNILSTKELNTKNKTTTKVVEAEPPKSYGNEDINYLFDSWEQACGFPITSKVKANRFACNRLIRSKGKDVIIQVLPIVAESHSDQFAPSIVNFMDLEQKWNNLGIWYRKKCATKNKHTIRVV